MVGTICTSSPAVVISAAHSLTESDSTERKKEKAGPSSRAEETVSRPEIIIRGGTNTKKSGSFSREAAAFVLGVGVSPRSKWDNK